MRRMFLVSALAVLALVLSCSKKSSPPPTAPGPACALSATALSFGTVMVGSSADRSLTLINTGGGTLAGTLSESCPEFSLVGTTSYSLSAGDSASFTVRFSPGSAGAKSCAMNTGSSCAAVSCSGTGQAAQGTACQVSPTSLDFSTIAVGETATRTFTITNAGTSTLSGTVREACADFRIRGDSTYSLAPAQSATFTVDFFPSSDGMQACSLVTGTGCANVTCSGRATGGLSAACQVAPTSLDFGTVPVGKGATCKEFTVTNVSTTTTISGGLSYQGVDWSCSPCTYYLNPGQSQTFTFCCEPHSVGVKEISVVISERNEFCSSVRCVGEGVEPPPECSVDVQGSRTNTILDLGTLAVGQRRDYPDAVDCGIANLGGGVLSGTVSVPCSQIGIHRPGGGSLSYDLANNQSLYFGVSFAPVAPGPQNCTVETGNGLCTDIRVRANAITSSSSCWVETPSINFGIVRPNAQPRTVQRFLRITSVYSTGLSGQVHSPCSDFRVSAAAYSLPPGGSAQPIVFFDIPSGTQQAGDRSCTLNLDATGTSDCPIVPCSATIKFTAGTATPLTLAFPATPLGQSRDLTFTITSSSAISGTVTIPCPEFTVVGSPSYSIPAGGQATFTIRYAPTAVGLHQCTISTGNDCESVWVYGTGYAP